MNKHFNRIEADHGCCFKSTKTYTHSTGLSVCFRQWRAESHCKFLHGYAIQVKFVFKSIGLDSRNWVVDFGSLKSLKGILEDTLDHKTIVAEDDPELETFQYLEEKGLLQLRVLPSVGCEALAYYIYNVANVWLKDAGYGGIQLESVEISEHGANSAIYGLDNDKEKR